MEENIFERPELQCLGKEKIEFLKSMTEKTKTKSPIEIFTLFQEYREKFSQGAPISNQEKKAILMAVRENLNEEEQKRFDYVIHMLF